MSNSLPSCCITTFQDSSRITALLNDEKNGITYLQDQKHTFQAKDGGREWSVYGFPVGLLVSANRTSWFLMAAFCDFILSGSRGSVGGHLTTKRKRLKVLDTI